MPIRFLSNQTTDEDISLDGALTTGTTLSVGTTLTIGTIAQIGSDTDKFLMSDSGVVKYVDGATLRGYIGAGTGSGSVTGVGGTAPIVSSGGTAPDISITNATGTTVGACAIQSSGVGISVSDSNGVYSISNSGMISWTSRADSGSDISLGNGGVLDIAIVTGKH